MKAIRLGAPPGGHGLVPELADVDAPRPGRGDMLVAMKACGLCGTDVEKIRGEYIASMPVLGHEAVGVVSSLGDGAAAFKEGDRVFPHHHVPDYSCFLCRAGNETMCDRYRSSNLVPGGFAESFLVPKWNVEKGGVLRLPGEMSFETGSLIEPLACCVRGLRRARAEGGESVLIAGAGPVGLMHALLLKMKGAEVILSDVSEARLGFAERLKAGRVVDAREADVPGEARSMTGGRGVDLAVVASGSKSAIIQALGSARKGGRVLLFGVPARGSVLDYDISSLYNSEQEVVTSYGAVERDAEEALVTLSSRGSDFTSLVTHRFPLSRFGEALEAASSAKAVKVVVTP